MGDSFRSEPLDRVTQIQQHFGDTAHADSADPREMQVLPSKKHFIFCIVSASERRVNDFAIRRVSLICATSSKISAARARRSRMCQLAGRSPMRSNASLSRASARHDLEQASRRSTPDRATSAPRPRARTLPHCSTGADRPRTETEPGSTACPPPPVPPPRRRPTGKRPVGLRKRRRHVRNERHFALQARFRRTPRASASNIRLAGLMDESHRQVRPARNSGQLSRAARFSVRDPWLPPVISTVNIARAASAAA